MKRSIYDILFRRLNLDNCGVLRAAHLRSLDPSEWSDSIAQVAILGHYCNLLHGTVSK